MHAAYVASFLSQTFWKTSHRSRPPRFCCSSADQRTNFSERNLGDQALRAASLDERHTPLLSAVELEASKVRVNLFCPGHKQGLAASEDLRGLIGDAALRHDVPELPALDNLFAAEGVIEEAQLLATDAFIGRNARYQGWSTFFLVNGSTCGVEAAILSCVRPGRAIVLPRNVHQSAIHALVLSGGTPVWVNPIYDEARDILHGVDTQSVAAALAAYSDEIDAVLIVSPTYHGVCSDVSALAELAHSAGVPLIVDEAHGAHFAFHPSLPTPAAACGADIVVQSTHKTLSALTQSAMIHVRSSSLVHTSRVSASLQLVQSTSPNYLLLSSLDSARDQMSRNGRALLEGAISLANDASRRIAALGGFSVLNTDENESLSLFALDPTRVTVLLPNAVSGYDLDEHLIGQFGVYAELPAFRHMTLIFTPGNTLSDVDTLLASLAVFAATTSDTSGKATPFTPSILSQQPVSVLSPREAFFAGADTVTPEEAVNRVSADTLCPYPPGIPVVLPGEKITAECIDFLKAVLVAGGSVSGAQDEHLSKLRVVKIAALARISSPNVAEQGSS